MRKPLVALTAVVAFAIAAPAAAPQANPQPNENASCVAHLTGTVGTPGGARREVHGPEEFPWGQLVSHFATEHEGGSFEECWAEQ